MDNNTTLTVSEHKIIEEAKSRYKDYMLDRFGPFDTAKINRERTLILHKHNKAK